MMYSSTGFYYAIMNYNNMHDSENEYKKSVLYWRSIESTVL